MNRERLSGLLVLLTVATAPLVADTVVMRDSGRLYLGVNDDCLQDNSSTFRVVVSY